MKTTRYFEQNVLRKRPYIRRELCEAIRQAPLMTEEQPDGRIRHWGYEPELQRYLRVVVEPDGETIHNAMIDEI